MSPLLIKGTTLALSASVQAESDGIMAAANPVIHVEEDHGVTYLRLAVGSATVEVGLGNADRLSLVELLLGQRIPESALCQCGKHRADEPWLHIQEPKPGRV